MLRYVVVQRPVLVLGRPATLPPATYYFTWQPATLSGWKRKRRLTTQRPAFAVTGRAVPKHAAVSIALVVSSGVEQTPPRYLDDRRPHAWYGLSFSPPPSLISLRRTLRSLSLVSSRSIAAAAVGPQRYVGSVVWFSSCLTCIMCFVLAFPGTWTLSCGACGQAAHPYRHTTHPSHSRLFHL